jgi:hypothetical protein
MLDSDFSYLRAVSDPRPLPDSPGYVVGAMMTPSHAHFGERLSESCRRFSLPLALFEIPTVHRSISLNGSDDLKYTKPNFVHFLLQRYGRPVLYVDVDCVIAQRPAAVDRLCDANTDFAIFNWLAARHTEAYVPADVSRWKCLAEVSSASRFYRFSHSIDHFSDTQLLCSGAVQWYNGSDRARRLLDQWQSVIEGSPRSADDKCLDHAFNNSSPSNCGLKVEWLAKRYARYAWWIYEQPVLDHPEMPSSGGGFAPLVELDGKPRIRETALRLDRVDYVFPKDCLIDTELRTLMRLREGVWHTVGPVTVPLWL